MIKGNKRLLIFELLVIVVCGYIIGYNSLRRIDYVKNIADSAAVVNFKDETTDVIAERNGNAELTALGYKININTADTVELMLLDGIGEEIARRIIEHRERIGGFDSVDRLLEVKGIGKKRLENIREFVTID